MPILFQVVEVIAVEDEAEEVGFVTSIDSMGPGCDLEGPACELEEEGGCEMGARMRDIADDVVRQNISTQEKTSETTSQRISLHFAFVFFFIWRSSKT